MLDFPDSPLGVKKINGTYYIPADSGYVRASGTSGIQGMTSPDMNSLGGNYTIYTPTTNLSLGGPNDFDRDYVGGGATIYDAVNNNIIILYHGEYHWVQGQPHFTGGLGLAYLSYGNDVDEIGRGALPVTIVLPGTGTADRAGETSAMAISICAAMATRIFITTKKPAVACRPLYTTAWRGPYRRTYRGSSCGRSQSLVPRFQKYSGGSFSTPAINTSNQALGGGASDNISPSLFMYDPVVRFRQPYQQIRHDLHRAVDRTFHRIFN